MTDVALFGIEIAGAVQPLDEFAVIAKFIHRDLPHAGHNPHVGDNKGAVSDFDADFRHRAAERTHQIGNDVQRPSLHATLE